MSYDGATFGPRVDGTTERKLHAKVVDNVLNSATYQSRIMGMGKEMRGKTYDYTIKVVDSNQGEWITGLEPLNSAQSNTTITMKYAHSIFTQPVVLSLPESMANTGPEATIDLDMFKIEEAQAETIRRLATAAYGTGSGDQILGLGAIVDDGTNVASIGGQSRSTYDQLKATYTDSSGTVSLSKLATLDDNCSAAGYESESPTIFVTNKTVWSLVERLLQPQVRAEYASVGYNAVAIRGKEVLKSRAELKGGAGFTAITFRGVPIIKDDAAPSGKIFALNENYLEWRGRTIVPSKYKGVLEKVSLGTPKTLEGPAANMPSDFHGFFFQKLQMMTHQAGMIGRYYVFGQLMTSQPRRHGVLHSITGI